MFLLLHHNCILYLMTSFLILLDLPKVIDQQWQTSVNSPLCFSGWPGLSPYCFFYKCFPPPTPLFQWLYSLLWRVTKIQNSHSKKSYFLLLQLLCACLVTQSCPALFDAMDCNPPGSLVHGDSPGKNIGVGCHAFLQGVFPIQVSCIAGEFFAIWATREAQEYWSG